ncbi:uncharacterized protein LOC109842236 [Asparagus officinalis]|uniref:uncharacterized protein LOC109842236 n=1 Tax=Asparagus officinalis TaxID=4686 RepID=UPI00098DE5F3|nr:uncharacterized protein LOC109842236 [Asparagus officinalis]
MHEKYSIPPSPSDWNCPIRCSPEWKKILAIKQVFSHLCGWTIGKGNVSFWYDRWHPEFLLDRLSPYEDIHLKLRDFCHEGNWCFENLIPTLGTNVVQALYDHAPRLTEDDDIRHWAPEKSGSFSVKSAWESIRGHYPTIPILADIWSTVTPFSAKLICWKIFHNILPVDMKAQHNGIALASKCVCCLNHKSESIEHLFVDSELAQSLWTYFSIIFAVPYLPAQSITTRIKWWFRICKGKSHFSIMGRLACIAICRQIWSYRNNSIYGGMKKDHMHARMVIIDTLQHLDAIVFPSMHSCKYGIDSLQSIGITPKSPKAKRISLHAWTPPRQNSYALNTDGSCRDNQTAIGGVIRNHLGNLICAFAGPSGEGTAFNSEVNALEVGADLIN